MKLRFTAAAALLIAVGVAGCSSPPMALSNHDAHVSINGRSTNALQPVHCSQNGKAWTIESTNKDPGFTATIQLGDQVTAQAVDIRNLGNFTGTYWNDNLGKAKAEVEGGQFSISGEASGSFADKPNQPATATFDIKTSC
jgi:ipoprotein LpqH